MPFAGNEQMRKDFTDSAGGTWIKLIDDQPVRLKILGYVGKFSSKKYENVSNYRFAVQTADGSFKNLDCNWRLMKALQEFAEQFQQAFFVTILQSKVIAEITDPQGLKKKQLVNDYQLTDVKEANDTEPF